MERFGSTLSTHRGVTDRDRRGREALIRLLTGKPDPTGGGKLTPTVTVNSILGSDIKDLTHPRMLPRHRRKTPPHRTPPRPSDQTHPRHLTQQSGKEPIWLG